MTTENKASGKIEKPKNQSSIDKFLGQPQPKQLEFALGHNLYLYVTKIGSCIYKYRCNYKGKLTWITLGNYAGKDRSGKIIGLSLGDAQIKAITFNQQIKDGINPREEFERDKRKGMTIAELVEKYYADQLKLVRKSENSQKQFIRAVNTDIVNTIGQYPIIDVDDDLMRSKVIQPKINAGSPSTARRAKINLKILFEYAIDELKLIKYNPALLIKSRRIYQDKAREKYLTMDELGLVLNIVYSAPIRTQYKIALHLIALLLPRKSEIQNATWKQVDFQNKTFTIINSKMGTDLLIKLPGQAVKLLEIQKQLSGDSIFIFPGRNAMNKPMSHNTLNYLLRPLLFKKIDDFVVHDLRRTGATNLGEMGYPVEIIEVALNHTKSGIQKVYHRTQYIEQRAKMLQDYADRIDKLINTDLLPYGKYFPI